MRPNKELVPKIPNAVRRIPASWLWPVPALLALLILACHLTGNEKGEDKISFSRLYDSLKVYDEVVIVLNDPDGNVLDTVYRGKVGRPEDVRNLPAPHWDGGKVLISITGFKGNRAVYGVVIHFDGETDERGRTDVFVSPDAAVSPAVKELAMIVGDTLPLPAVAISPANLADTGLEWNAEPSDLLRIGNGAIQAVAAGSASLTVRLRSNPTAASTLPVTIAPAVSKPDSLQVRPDSLRLVPGGASRLLSVQVFPSGAFSGVRWSSEDSTVASVDTSGRVQGLRPGETRIRAVSRLRDTVRDSARIVVADTALSGPPIVQVDPAGPTRERRPAWSWASGGGTGAYQISLDRSVFDSAAMSVNETGYRPASDLAPGTHVLYVRERDAAGNWSLPGSAQVDIDTGAPAVPRIYGTSPTSALPRWSWSTGGGGGSGVFRFRLGNAGFAPADSGSQDTAYALASADDGTTYTLFVEERDAAGNWSPPASLAIQYDLTRPTVTFILPQASGIFITAEDTVIVSGTCAARNGIRKLEYALDGGTANPVAVEADGSWRLASLNIPDARTTTILVIATDSLGNTGQAQIQILRDGDPPLPPAALVKPASPTNVSLSSWSWSAGSDGNSGSGLNGRYRWKMNAGSWTEISAPSATATLPAEGLNTFSVQEQDKAGNWSESLTGTAILDTHPPDAVSFVGQDGNLTASQTPTWTWAPSAANGGIGQYILKLDSGAEFDGGTATTYTPTTALPDNAAHTLTVKEKDQVAGVFGAANSFSFKVKANPPEAPTVKSAEAGAANGGWTNNPGFTWTSGGGGNGKYRVKVNNEPAYRINGTAQTAFTLAATDTDGTYIIHVSEQDDLGRWGPEGAFTIRLDRTGPDYTEVKIKGSAFALREGYITNQPSLTISYKADGAVREFSCTLSKDNAPNSCSAANTDSLGNSSTLARTIWRRSNVVFFTQTGAGAKDGSSWENARSDLKGYVEYTDSAQVNGKDVWMASGDYSSQSFSFLGKWISAFGGFDADAYPIDTTGRDKKGTRVGSLSFYYDGANTSVWDGILFQKGFSTISSFTLQDCQSLGPINIFAYDVQMKNCDLVGVSGESGPALLVLSGAGLTWDGGRIIDNVFANGYAVEVYSVGALTLKGLLSVSGNAAGGTNLQIHNQGDLTIDSAVSISCNTVFNDGGSGSCKGTSL